MTSQAVKDESGETSSDDEESSPILQSSSDEYSQPQIPITQMQKVREDKLAAKDLNPDTVTQKHPLWPQSHRQLKIIKDLLISASKSSTFKAALNALQNRGLLSLNDVNLIAKYLLEERKIGISLLLRHLYKSERWFECLLSTLYHPRVRLSHIAQQIQESIDSDFLRSQPIKCITPGTPKTPTIDERIPYYTGWLSPKILFLWPMKIINTLMYSNAQLTKDEKISSYDKGQHIDPYLDKTASFLMTCWSSLFSIIQVKLQVQQGDDVNHLVIVTMPQKSPVQGTVTYNDSVSTDKEALTFIAMFVQYSQCFQSALLQLVDHQLFGIGDIVQQITQMTDTILKVYTHQALGFSSTGLPLLRNVQQKIDIMKHCLMKLADTLHTEFVKHSSHFKVTRDSMLCTLLGLNDDIKDYLSQINPDLRSHQSVMYFIERFMEDVEKSKIAEDTMEVGIDEFEENLQLLGFTSETSQLIRNSVAEELIPLQLPSFWAKQFLNHVVSYHPVLLNMSRYPYQSGEGDPRDEFFTENVQRDDQTDNPTSSISVKIINVFDEPSASVAINAHLEQERSQHKLLFHGTSHINTVSILTDGIKLSKGNSCQDFSDDDGFYLSETLGHAREWAHRSRGSGSRASALGSQNHGAVIVFRVDSNFPDIGGGLNLVQPKDKAQWEEIVQFCRIGRGTAKKKKALLGQYTFIRGPMCLNPFTVTKGHRANGFGRDDKIQVCVRCDQFAENLSSEEQISCVIFY